MSADDEQTHQGAHEASDASVSVPHRAARKRLRSPPWPVVVADYRPYGGGQLRRCHERLTGGHAAQWNLYYRNNTVNGYKDRHYILREFHELRQAIEAAERGARPPHGGHDTTTQETRQPGCSSSSPSLSFSWLEAGCGVGNAMLPIFEQYGTLPAWRALFGFDISSVAIALLQKKRAALPAALAAKLHLCTLDPCTQSVHDSPLFAGASSSARLVEAPSAHIRHASAAAGRQVDFVSLIFVLCSIPVASHRLVLERIAACMRRPGAVLFFRDYAVADHAAHRFSQRKGTTCVSATSVSDTAAEACSRGSDDDEDDGGQTFVRTNGTLSHFFAMDEVCALFTSVGFRVRELREVERSVRNRKTSVLLARRFIQGRFVL